jgi:hypothetical protein
MSDLSPANVRIAENRAKTTGRLPFKGNDENELKLSLRGDVAMLALNGTKIYEAPLSPDNNRIFGLFHWLGETEARVRAVTYRGNWPKSLPAVKDQESAEVDPSLLAVDTKRLPERVSHDFTLDGLGTNLFSPRGGGLDQIAQATPAGVTVSVVGADTWRESSLSLRRVALGDFDFTAAYDDLKIPPLPTGSAGVAMSVTTNSPLAPGTRAGRRESSGGGTIFDSQYSADAVDGTKRYITRDAPAAGTSGEIRAVRRGPVIHYFYRSRRTDPWRYFDTMLLGRAEYTVDMMLLQISAYQAPGQQVSVRWKSMDLYAEALRVK